MNRGAAPLKTQNGTDGPKIAHHSNGLEGRRKEEGSGIAVKDEATGHIELPVVSYVGRIGSARRCRRLSARARSIRSGNFWNEGVEHFDISSRLRETVSVAFR